jgi:hypothetical protein
MIDTQELIARLEAATGPDRELDAEIAAVAKVNLPPGCDWAFKFPRWQADHSRHGRVNVIGNVNGNGDYIAAHFIAPTYTASIDAALTLMPELWNYVIGSPGIEETELDKWCVNIAMHPDDRGDLTFAPTPALAICIAALKARSQTDD